MRIVVLLIIAVPSLMAMRTLALLRDWLALSYWVRSGAPKHQIPLLHEPPPPGASPKDAIAVALHRFRMSFLLTAAAACFATAATAILLAVMGR